ncbi:APC family permease [Actinomadura barringtoniae]|uniref:APC family permease n=1 Tax=Actinomadura barringtoniae TaxID=1427535 RepID=A0A939PAE1_9ACTN|nr:APC family permease [Actinomadura barringtoniae]MBO2445639.1 APC family permease [Actinomadura barringtoniae]
MSRPADPADARLSAGSIGLPQALFQSVTHMGPAAGIASSLLVAISFAGPTMPLAIGLAMVVCLLIATAVAQLARHVTTAGGLADYATAGLGPRAGRFVSWLYPVLELLIAPIVFMVLGQILAGVFDRDLGVTAPWWLWMIVAAALSAYLNVRGVRSSTNAGIVLGAFEIAVFTAFAVYLIVHNAGDNTARVFVPSHALEPGLSGVFKGMVFSILAFQGFETAAPLAEETQDSRRVIPRVIVLSTLVVGAFYLLCGYASVIGWGFDDMAAFAANPDPWGVLARRFWGIGWVVILFALVNSFVGNGNAGVAAASRILYALGRQGTLPKAFGRVHPVHATPANAVYAQTALTIVLGLALGASFGVTKGFSVLATVVTVFAIVLYMVTCAACVAYFRRRRPAEFRWFPHAVCPVAAILILLVPLYYQVHPWPAYPLAWGNWFCIGWIAAAAVAATAFRRRPEPMDRSAQPVRQATPGLPE